jgi:hypothetical protein
VANHIAPEFQKSEMNLMGTFTPNPKQPVRGKWFFLSAFIFSCFLFWWIPSVLYRLVVHQTDRVDEGTLAISVLSLAFFIAGYLCPWPDRTARRLSEPLLDGCGDFTYNFIICVFPVALVLAVIFWLGHRNIDYLGAPSIPFVYQAVLYPHLFIGLIFIGSANPKKEGWRRLLTATILLVLPRLIIALHYQRFFLAQGVVPALLIAIARGWLHLSAKRMLQIAALALAILFVPAFLRGDRNLGQNLDLVEWFANGSNLIFYQDNTTINLSGYCNPVFVSFTAKVIPYHVLKECVLENFASKTNVPATLDRIVTANNPATFQGQLGGSGGNFMLNLYLIGGLFAVYAGSAVFGFTCRRFIGWIGMRSLYSGIWAECLVRALFAPRGELGYVFELIPPLILTTWCIILLVWAGRFLKRESARCIPERRGVVYIPSAGNILDGSAL